MANEGKRCYCRCIQDMTLIIGKQEEILFACKQVYLCRVKTSDTQANYYKIYGKEFALSCSEDEFKAHFQLIKHHQTS